MTKALFAGGGVNDDDDDVKNNSSSSGSSSSGNEEPGLVALEAPALFAGGSADDDDDVKHNNSSSGNSNNGNEEPGPVALEAPAVFAEGGADDDDGDIDNSNDSSGNSNDGNEEPGPAALEAPAFTAAVPGALLVPGQLPALPCARCFRLVGAGTGPVVLPSCTFSAGSCRCSHTSCRKKGNCRPLPGLIAGDLLAFWALVGAVAARPAVAADEEASMAVRKCGHALRLAMDAHRRQYGLTGSRVDAAREREYEDRVERALALVAPAAAGRQHLLCLRPEGAGYGAVRALLAAVVAEVLQRAQALLAAGEAAALRAEVAWAFGL